MRLKHLAIRCSILLEAQPEEVFQNQEHTVVYSGNEYTSAILRKIDGVYEDVTMDGGEIRFVIMPRAYDKVRLLLKLKTKDNRIELSTFFDDMVMLADVTKALGAAKKEPAQV